MEERNWVVDSLEKDEEQSGEEEMDTFPCFN